MSKIFSKIGGFLKRHKKLFIILLILIIAGVVIYFKFVKKQAQVPEADTTTLTTAVEKMDLQSSISVTGTLAAGDSASVTSTLTGVKVAAVNYEVGDYVEEGTVVVEMDGDDLEDTISDLDLDSEISTMETDHNLEDLQDQIQDLQDEIDEKADIYNNLVELKALYKKYPDDEEIAERYETENAGVGGIDSYIENYESLFDQLEDAQYNYQLALLNQTKSNNQTQDSYDDAYEQIDNTQITAPISGYITAINVEEGNNYTQGSTIFTIADTSSYVVEATVDEYDISSLEKGMQCVVKFDATDDDEFAGELTYVALTTDSTTDTSSSSSSMTSSSSSGYDIKITLTDTDDRLRAGMTAKASVILESVSDVLAVPYDCVETDSDGNSYVTVVDDEGNESKVTVTLGMESDYYVEIQSDEISEGTLVKATASSSSSSSSEDDAMLNFDMGGGDMGGGQGGGQAPSGGGMGGGPGGN